MFSRRLYQKMLAALLLAPSIELSGMNVEEQQGLIDYDRRFLVAVCRQIMSAVRWILLATVPPLLVSPPPHQRVILLTTHSILLVISWGFESFHRRCKIDPRYTFVLFEVIVALGYGQSVHSGFLGGPDVIGVIFGSALLILIMVNSVVVYPFSNGSVLLFGLFLVANAAFSWRAEPYKRLFDWTVVMFLAVALDLAIFYATTHRRRRDMLNELATRSLLISNERSRFALVEHDLRAAGEMQNAFTPTSTVKSVAGYSVECYQVKFGLIGGDWMATRTLADGRSLIVVGDATGKGVQGALVVQAVQTLWADALNHAEFSPAAWIGNVNRALLSIGDRRHHTMSLGMIVLTESNVTYYAAAHLPLFVMCRDAHRNLEMKPLLARGGLLGLAPDLDLSPVTLEFSGRGVESLLLATDGVFDRGLRTRKQAVVDLLADVTQRGVKALEDCPAADDKLLVWIKRDARTYRTGAGRLRLADQQLSDFDLAG